MTRWGTLLLMAAAIGCGGSSQLDITTAPDGSANDATTGGGDGSTTNDGGVAQSDAPTDGPPTIVRDGGGGGADATPGGTTSQINCGSTTCAIPSETCCVYTNRNPPPPFQYACATGNGCPQLPGTDRDPTELKCSSAANCPANTVCCVRDDGNRLWSECSATCADSNGVKTAVLCNPATPQQGCPPSTPCSSNNIGDWNLPRGFGTCGGRGN